jgi:hypothetical protein
MGEGDHVHLTDADAFQAQAEPDRLVGEALGVPIAVEPPLLGQGDQAAVLQHLRRGVMAEPVDPEDAHATTPSIWPCPRVLRSVGDPTCQVEPPPQLAVVTRPAPEQRLSQKGRGLGPLTYASGWCQTSRRVDRQSQCETPFMPLLLWNARRFGIPARSQTRSHRRLGAAAEALGGQDRRSWRRALIVVSGERRTTVVDAVERASTSKAPRQGVPLRQAVQPACMVIWSMRWRSRSRAGRGPRPEPRPR